MLKQNALYHKTYASKRTDFSPSNHAFKNTGGK